MRNKIRTLLNSRGLHLKFTKRIRMVLTVNTFAIQKVLSEGVQMMFFFVVDEGIEDPNITLNGPSSAR